MLSSLLNKIQPDMTFPTSALTHSTGAVLGDICDDTGENLLLEANDTNNPSEHSASKRSCEFTPLKNTLFNMSKTELMYFKKESICGLDSFHRAFGRTIIIAQFFGYMPVIGITGRNASFIRFKWMSLRVIYTTISLLGIAFNTTLCAIRFYKYGHTFKELQCSVFYGCSFIRMLLFLVLARDWPTLAAKWEQVEVDLAHYGYPQHLYYKFNIITAIILTVALVEHCFSHIRVIRLAVLCAVEDKMDGICTFLFNSFPHVYDYFPCALWNGILTTYTNLICAFGWTYVDIFIILMSIALAERFRQLNKCLQSLQGKALSSEFWYRIRMDYNTLSNLTKFVDSYISKIVFISFANNLYSVCMQLLNSLHPPQNGVQMLYFCLSFGCIVVRILAVSICAARVNELSKQPRIILYSVPSRSYSTEVERFLQQVTTDDVVLTGLNFFSITRTLLVTVVGTIVTYELVLVQFSGIHEDERDLMAHSVAKRYCL